MEQNIITSIVIEVLNELSLVKRKGINFPNLLAKCNPYALVVNCKNPQEVVDFVLQRHKQTSSETIWGYLLESIAVKVSKITLNGYKSEKTCTDIEWGCDGKKHYRGWKSSPNWANSDQKKNVNNEESEMKILKDFGSFKVLTSYGKTSKRSEKNTKFIQLSGQDAWEEISNDVDLYNKVLIGIEKNSENTGQFMENLYISDKETSIQWVKNNFTNEDESINFIKVNEYVSGRDKVKVTKW
jgi:hypothetical protein